MTTGRFATRDELEEWVRYTYYNTPANMADIARQCRVSTTTVSNILNKGLRPCLTSSTAPTSSCA